MNSAKIWWDSTDKGTPELIARLGGKAVVEEAVTTVLPGRTVKLQTLTPGISGSSVFLASPETSYGMRRVSEVYGVLKVGPARLLADELGRYDRWVAHVLAHASNFAPLDALHNLTEIARQSPESIQALHYRHVGHTTFGERVKDLITVADKEALCRLIDSVLTILRPWQEMCDAVVSKSLTAPGVYSFASDPFAAYEETCERLNKQCVGDEAYRIDPAIFRQVRDLWRVDTLSPERQLQTILHGDLHIDNVLIDTSDTAALIDFGATGEGHFLRDLSTLEAHLLLRGLAPSGGRVSEAQRQHIADLELLYSPQAFLEPSVVIGETPLFTAVSRLRRYAFYCLMHGDAYYMSQYAFGVLRHAIRLCVRPDDGYTDAQRWASAKVTTFLRRILTVDNHRLIIRDAEQRYLVQSGFSFLDDPPSDDTDPDGVNASPTEICTAEQWEALAKVLRSQRRIDFIGIVPTTLISALLKIWEQADTSAEPLPQIRYVTLPSPLNMHSGGLPVPNWRMSLMGMRNLSSIKIGTRSPLDRFAQVTDSATSNCVIRAIAGGGTTTLYFAGQVTGPGATDKAVTLSVLPDKDGRISDVIDTTLSVATPFIIREVDCQPLGDTKSGEDGTALFQAVRLWPYGDSAMRSQCLQPIALTILRTRGPGGRQVLVKMRSPLFDNDDFGRLSFLSTRILAHDVAQAYGHVLEPAEDADDALVELWESIGSPDPFILTEQVFIQAAKRDVYETTLLDLDASRFTKHGCLIMSREDNGVQLGFTMLTVDLTQAEVAAARRVEQAFKDPKGPVLRVMKVNDLLSGTYPVNRIMRERKEWLQEHCLGPHIA